ncbi:MAG: prepilin-type N-terminal cleavage/methylation domain-containing protein [Planctomycetota bacterium]
MKFTLKKGFTLIELMIVIAIIAIIAAIAIPNLIEARKHGNEAAAIGALKTITTAQSLFREGDKETDTNFDYGSLNELSTATLIDGVLGSGTKQGYTFATAFGVSTSEFLWFATANPAVPGTTGDRYFCTNQAGVIYYTSNASIAMNSTTCAIPATVLPVGK